MTISKNTIHILPIEKADFSKLVSDVKSLYDKKKYIYEGARSEIYKTHNISPEWVPSQTDAEEADKYLQILKEVGAKAREDPLYEQYEEKLESLQNQYADNKNDQFESILSWFLGNMTEITNGRIESVFIDRTKSYNYPLDEEDFKDIYNLVENKDGLEIEISLDSETFWCYFSKTSDYGKIDKPIRDLFGNDYIHFLNFSPLQIHFIYGTADEGYEYFKNSFNSKYEKSIINDEIKDNFLLSVAPKNY